MLGNDGGLYCWVCSCKLGYVPLICQCLIACFGVGLIYSGLLGQKRTGASFTHAVRYDYEGVFVLMWA